MVACQQALVLGRALARENWGGGGGGWGVYSIIGLAKARLLYGILNIRI